MSTSSSRPDAASAVYLHGLVRRATRPALRGRGATLPDAGAPRVLAAGRSLWLLVSDVPLASFGEAALERRLRDLEWVSRCALAHERILASFVGKAPIVPMKPFTIFASDARALAHVERQRASLERLVRRVSGCAEWTARVTFDEDRARALARSRSLVAERAPSGRRSGAQFLLQKKAMREAAVDLRARAKAITDDLFEGLSRIARERTPVRTLVSGARLALDASFLVPTAKAAAFRATGRRLSRAGDELGADAFLVTLSGPWPPYHFVGDRS
jgi:gas vesicle protein GvpL/GvpF